MKHYDSHTHPSTCLRVLWNSRFFYLSTEVEDAPNEQSRVGQFTLTVARLLWNEWTLSARNADCSVGCSDVIITFSHSSHPWVMHRTLFVYMLYTFSGVRPWLTVTGTTLRGKENIQDLYKDITEKFMNATKLEKLLWS